MATFVRNYTAIHEAEDITIGDFVPGDALVFNATMDGLIPLRALASLDGLTTGQVPYFDGSALADAKIQYLADGRISIGPSANGREMFISSGGGEITLPTAPLWLQRDSAYGVAINNHLTVYGGTAVGIDDWAATSDHLIIGTEVGGNKISMWDRVSSGTLLQAGFVSTEFQVGADGVLDYLSQIDELAASYAAPSGRIFRRASATPTGTVQAFGDVVGGNTTKIEEDGTLVFIGSAKVTEDANVSGLFLTGPAVSTPSITEFIDNVGAATGLYGLGFAVGEFAGGTMEIPHAYAEGSDIQFHFHFSVNDAPTGTDKIRFQLTYSIHKHDGTFPPPTIVLIETDVAAQYQRYDVAFADIVGTGINIADQFCFTLERIAATADEYAGLAIVETVGIHYELDTLGSRDRLTK